MCTCSSFFSIRRFQQLLVVICSFLMIISQAKPICPLIETLSFGSDINYRCNESHLVFNEFNKEGLIWKFEDEADECDQNGVQTTVINRCKLTRMNSRYLKVPFKSSENYEKACVYCRINYKSMMPVITATQSDEGDKTLYIFNITAIALAPNESVEILWAKRVHTSFRHSYNYWFTRGCIDDTTKILVHNRHSIVFAVDDFAISRVEFIIRRCDKSCRQYNRCLKQQFLNEIEANSFDIPDQIEKISCDEHCLNGEEPSSRPAMTHTPRVKIITNHYSTIQTPIFSKEKLKYLIISLSICFAILFISFILLWCLINKFKKREASYAKATTIDPDERK